MQKKLIFLVAIVYCLCSIIFGLHEIGRFLDRYSLPGIGTYVHIILFLLWAYISVMFSMLGMVSIFERIEEKL